ncbi:MAG: hypothetical protein ACP5D4_06395 [Baaleninema sp.]
MGFGEITGLSIAVLESLPLWGCNEIVTFICQACHSDNCTVIDEGAPAAPLLC